MLFSGGPGRAEEKSLCSEPANLEGERVWCSARTSGGMNTQSHIGFFSDPELFTDIRSPDIIL